MGGAPGRRTRVGRVSVRARLLPGVDLVDPQEWEHARKADSTGAREVPGRDGNVKAKVESTEHNFQIVLGVREVDAKLSDRLFEAGCGDAALVARDGLVFLDFDREAPTFEDAVTSAIRDVRKAGLLVVRVEPDDLVNQAQIGERAGRTRASINQLVQGQRGPGGFPAPHSGAGEGRLWRWSEVSAWLAQLNRDPLPREELARARFVAFVNTALSFAQARERTPAMAAAMRVIQAKAKAKPKRRAPSVRRGEVEV